jgi:cbb3-type cytochrome oxidase maturation protein
MAMVELTLLQLLVAACMGLGALCLLLWAYLSDQFDDIEQPKYRAYWAEVLDDERYPGEERRR